MVLTNLTQQDNYNIPISDWLSNRTLRNFLSNHSESTWPEIVKITALLGVFTLNYKSEDGENTRWGHDDLKCLVDYIQKEKQWPEELSPEFLRPLQRGVGIGSSIGNASSSQAAFKKPTGGWRGANDRSVFRPRGPHDGSKNGEGVYLR